MATTLTQHDRHGRVVRLTEDQTATVPLRELVLIRHGETPLNAEDKIRGHLDPPLTEQGKAQVKAAGGYIKQQFPETDCVYCSDLQRSTATAQAIADALGGKVEIRALKALRPWDVGHHAGQTSAKAHPELMKYIKTPDKVIPGGESFNTYKQRFLAAINTMLIDEADETNEPLVIVVHHRGERMLHAYADGDGQKGHVDPEAFDSRGADPGSVQTLRIAPTTIQG